jgi:hypothetical protein
MRSRRSFIGHGTQETKRMILRDSLLGAYITENIQLCSSFPRMPFSYQLVLWKQESFLVLGHRPSQFMPSASAEILNTPV